MKTSLQKKKDRKVVEHFAYFDILKYLGIAAGVLLVVALIGYSILYFTGNLS